MENYVDFPQSVYIHNYTYILAGQITCILNIYKFLERRMIASLIYSVTFVFVLHHNI